MHEIQKMGSTALKRYLPLLLASVLAQNVYASANDNETKVMPIIRATATPQIIKERKETDVTLDASRTLSGNADPANFLWIHYPTNGNNVEIEHDKSSVTKAKFPDRRGHEEHVFAVRVENTNGQALYSRQIKVNYSPTYALAEAKPSTIQGSGSVMLIGIDSKSSNNEELDSYTWSQLEGPQVQIAHPNSSTTSVHIPEVETLTHYVFKLKVTDKEGISDTHQVMVTASPKDVTKCSDETIPNWDPEKIYRDNENVKVCDEGKIYQNHYWTQNKKPSENYSCPNAENPWKPIEPIAGQCPFPRHMNQGSR